MKHILLGFCCLLGASAYAQPYTYTTAKVHSHNDYERAFPFWGAYNEGFGSIEADLHLVNDTLFVAHDKITHSAAKTFEALYLEPLVSCVRQNAGYPYADKQRNLQLLIDIKTDSTSTLASIVKAINRYPELVNAKNVKFVITGNRPAPAQYINYPAFIWFDGNVGQTYSTEALSKIALLSADFHRFTSWNGKGVIPEKEKAVLQSLIAQAHEQHKPIRFWASPDVVNAWYNLMKLDIDFLNTDNINELSSFLKELPKRSYKNDQPYETYDAKFVNDKAAKKVKNVILLIGDGTGLAQWYSGYTANHGKLNVFNMRSSGLSKTSSHDSYITDSAPGSTAFASGQKTNNRYVGVDHTGAPMKLLPDYFIERKIKTGLVSCGDLTDATPADFYGHVTERENSLGVLRGLYSSPVQLLMGAPSGKVKDSENAALNASGIRVTHAIDSVPSVTNERWVVMDKVAGLSMLQGRDKWLGQAFDKAVKVLSNNKEGFFLMVEGAQIDHGGHDTNLPYIATEVMDFDQVIGQAMKFADENGETLVIVTADHETGGLSLLDGDIKKGYVSGNFSSNDHSALPVPVFAYGPQSDRFTGVYENVEIFNKILAACGINIKK
ncbi:MAG: alkaline phosphatase [Filimonas sp.]|nr:alkaline phosphatase [Filimonas sp.]